MLTQLAVFAVRAQLLAPQPVTQSLGTCKQLLTKVVISQDFENIVSVGLSFYGFVYLDTRHAALLTGLENVAPASFYLLIIC